MGSMLRISLISALISLSILAKPAYSQHQDAHVHGLAQLTLALEANTLEMQFESPAANLVGFEHKASSPEEKQTVKRTETLLGSPKLLFSFAGTNCESIETEVDISGVMDNKHDHHEHHDHSEDHSDSSHSEIIANYRFSCKNAKDLESVSVALFSRFPSIEKINAMWVTDLRQGSEVLNSDRNTLSLR